MSFLRFEEISSMALQDIKGKKHYGSMQAQCENSKPTTNTVCGWYNQFNKT